MPPLEELAGAGLVEHPARPARTRSTRNALSFEVDPGKLAQTLDEAVLEDERRYYHVMLGRLSYAGERNADVLDRLTRDITRMLWAILVMLCGLALAALVG